MKFNLYFGVILLMTSVFASAQVTLPTFPVGPAAAGVAGEWGHASIPIVDRTTGGLKGFVVADPLHTDPAAPGSSGALHFLDPTGNLQSSIVAGINVIGTSLGQCLVSVGDFNGDGVDEIAASVVEGTDSKMILFDPISRSAIVATAPLNSASLSQLGAVSVADFNADGIRDLVVTDGVIMSLLMSFPTSSNYIMVAQVLLNTPFVQSLTPLGLGKVPLLALDTDSDGFDEILTWDNLNSVQILSGLPIGFATPLASILGPGGPLAVEGFGASISLIENAIGGSSKVVAISAPVINTVQVWDVKTSSQTLISSWTSAAGEIQTGRSLATISRPIAAGGDLIVASSETPGVKNLSVIDQAGVLQYSLPSFRGAASNEVFLSTMGDFNSDGHGDILICEPSPTVTFGTYLAGAPARSNVVRGAASTGFGAPALPPTLAVVHPSLNNAVGAPVPMFTATFGTPIVTAALYVGPPVANPGTQILPGQFIYLVIDPAFPVVPLVAGPGPNIAVAAYPFSAPDFNGWSALAGVRVTAQAVNTDGTFFEFTNGIDLTLGY